KKKEIDGKVEEVIVPLSEKGGQKEGLVLEKGDHSGKDKEVDLGSAQFFVPENLSAVQEKGQRKDDVQHIVPESKEQNVNVVEISKEQEVNFSTLPI
ncbi:unnamed protein product, partial [Ilex paraguariensis]